MSHQNFDPIAAMAEARHEFGEHGGVNMSIEISTTFTVLEAGTMPEIFGGRLGPDTGGCYLYGRHFNPTVFALGKQLAALEGAAEGYCAASGMGAIAATLLQLCDSGDTIVSSDTVYGGTHALLRDYFPRKAGITTTFVDTTDHAAVEAALSQGAKVLFLETLANPTLVVADIPKLSEIAARHGATMVVDNTFSPLVFSPILLGADVVVHSATKFIGGASDIIAGVVCGSTEFVGQLMDLHLGSLMLLGATMDPNVAFRLSMRLPHLGLRMKEHGRRAMFFAERLEGLGLPIVYPGLASHPQHELMNELRHPEYGYGGLFTLDTGSLENANALMERLQNVHRFGFMAVSLGYFESLLSCSGTSTSSEMTDAARAASGITPGLVRISMGYTGNLEERWEQMEESLRAVGLVG